MKRFKKYKGIIMGFIIGGITASSITVCAMIGANSVTYTNDKTVEAALNELYTKIPRGTKTINEKGNQIDVGAYKYADTTGLYTSTEYQNFGNEKYQEGIEAGENAVANAVGYKAGIYEVTTTGKNYINCGFKPKYVLVKLANTDDTKNVYVYFYDEKISMTKSYRRIAKVINEEADEDFTMEGDNEISHPGMHIYKVDSSGFGFYFNKTGKKIYWCAFQ